MRTLVLAALCLLLLTSGCVGGGPPALETPPTDGSPSPTSSTATATAPPESTTTRTPTPTPTGARTILVDVTPPSPSDRAPGRNYTELMGEAAAYWESNVLRYTDRRRNVTFVLKRHAADPDLEVTFVENIDSCGEEESERTTLGCSYGELRLGDSNPERIHIRIGFSDNSTVGTIKHEVGHALGISHGEPPMPLMNATGDAATLPKTDAVNRSNPWQSPGDAGYQQTTLRVAIDFESGTPRTTRREVERQVERVRDYYNASADGTIAENRTFVPVSDVSRADIVVRIDKPMECNGGDGSCVYRYGRSVDTDRALETYDRVNISVVGIPPDRTGWHVGAWMTYALGIENVENNPPPFDDPDTDDREDWWR